MPLLANYVSPTTRPGTRPRLAATPGVRSLTFLRPIDSGFGSQDGWGESIFGWNEITPAGFQADVVIPRSSDEYSGIPMTASSAPTTGQIQVNIDPRSELNAALGQCHRGIRFEMRHIMAPPNMHLIYGEYLFHGAERTAVSGDAGALYNITMTPLFNPVEVAGSYYESQAYDESSIGAANGTSLRRVKSPHEANFSALDRPGYPDSVGVHAEQDGRISLEGGNLTSGTGGIPTGNSVQAIVYAPQVGYALTRLSVGVPSNLEGLTIPTTQENANSQVSIALARDNPAFFVAAWDAPATLFILRDV